MIYDPNISYTALQWGLQDTPASKLRRNVILFQCKVALQAGGSIMCNLATISTGRKGHQVSGGLSLIFHSASPNGNSKSIRFPVVFFPFSCWGQGTWECDDYFHLAPQAKALDLKLRESTDDAGPTHWWPVESIPQLKGLGEPYICACCNIVRLSDHHFWKKYRQNICSRLARI